MGARILPPGPTGHPLLGSALDFRRDPMGTFLAAKQQYGDLVRFRGPVKVHLVSGPDHFRHILVDNFANYQHPTDFDRKISAAVGEGLVTTSGPQWTRQRTMVESVLRKDYLTGFAEIMADRGARLARDWAVHAARGVPFDARPDLHRLTLDVLASCLFTADWVDDATDLAGAVRVELAHLNRKLIAIVDLPEWVPTPRNRRFVLARNALDRIVFDLIRARRSDGADPDRADLLAMLMAVRDPDTGVELSDRQLRDQVTTLFVAGHETAAATLGWLCHCLATHPDVAERAAEEVRAVLGDRPPTMRDLPQLKYLRMVVSEVLRLYPPLWQVARMPLADDELGGYHVPAGSFLLLNTFLLHRDPEFWPMPERFEPERFERGAVADRPRFAYQPYLTGPRNCVGMAFATMELTIVAASILQRLRLAPVPGHPVEFQPDITLGARHGIVLTASARKAHTS
ncbi:cytochrome P450 [Solihabitans fulvus]|uniref:Cytochrome P450 n=1 Tax=Solihabitans fulvus TaxID=1892852 RepID=A0A5B2XFR2_9PSEU|nr:cytochrome P450 [Solihabitans fulvus]KAA2262617.1 cytochrome P450 [Solihabitans fulvus]